MLEIIIGILISIGINFVLWVIAVRMFSNVYQNKFETLVGAVRDAMTERDLKLRKIEAMLSRALVTDTALFDHMLDDNEEELPNGREEQDPE